MDNMQFFTLIIAILSPIIGCFVYLISELRSFEKEIRADVSAQAGRTDKLYEVIIKMLEK